MAKESDKIARSRRRKHKFRMRRRADKAYPGWEKAWQSADHLKVCSCWMCGNPRRFEKSDLRSTLAERRFDLRAYDDWFWDDATPSP